MFDLSLVQWSEEPFRGKQQAEKEGKGAGVVAGVGLACGASFSNEWCDFSRLIVQIF